MTPSSAFASALPPAGLWPASGGVGGVVGAVLSSTRMAGIEGSVADGGCPARPGAGEDGAGAAGFGPPCERKAAERDMSRDPHPGQVTMLSGSDRGPTGVLQRGQFMSRRLGHWAPRPQTRV